MKYFQLLFFTFMSSLVMGQSSSSDIFHKIEQVKSPYRVLYLAAHPDDENTRLISYFANEVMARTAYLSLTRGDGGQNLIGKEKGALLGVLRTEELLAARRIDGGEQFFTRAVDFGYSKTSEETFSFWGKDEILSDVVYIVRYFKPHIIINRFPTENYRGHGHHHASALLSAEAFDVSGKEDVFAEHLKELEPWSPGTLYLNSSTWWDKSLEERAKNDYSISTVDVGSFSPNLGFSYTELAAKSRSQHKSQGFGSAPTKGKKAEYLEYLKGNFQAGSLLHEGLLDSVDRKWMEMAPLIDSVLETFDHARPSTSIPALMEVKKRAAELNSEGRFDKKIEQLNEIILMCAGISAELVTEQEVAYREDKIKVDVEVINRSNMAFLLTSVTCKGEEFSWNRPLEFNQMFTDTLVVQFDSAEGFTTPYWLDSSFSNRFNHDQKLLKRPNTGGKTCAIKLSFENEEILVHRPLIYKWTDRVKGGLSKNLSILPEMTIRLDREMYFTKDSLLTGNVFVSYKKGMNDKNLNLYLNDEKQHASFAVKSDKHAVLPFSRKLTAGKASSELKASVSFGDVSFNKSLTTIQYDHITDQEVLMPSKSKMVHIPLKNNDLKIGYVEGPDNEMIDYLKSWGCEITNISRGDVLEGKLKNYDVVLFGIRSINVDPSWKDHHQELKEYMKEGGLVVMMYQTVGANPMTISPYSFQISRKRVTNEQSSVNLSKPDHKIFNEPYSISKSDFKNWNQERGLYFADAWEENFSTVISWHDKNELDEFGSIIVGDYGKGAFIYTGISFFRHIPNGVEGSYKLLINLLSYAQ